MSEAFVEVPFEVQKPQDGQRLDAYLAARLQRYSRAEVQKLISAGRVFLRGRAAKSSARVAAGETVLIRYPQRDEPASDHAALPVIFESDRLLAINKPGGVLSHPTDKTLKNAATTILRAQFPDLKLHLLHRLDRETSGVLMFAKDPRTARSLGAAFFARETAKVYLAIAQGRVAWDEMELDIPLDRQGGEIRVRQKAGKGQPALTVFERLAASDRGSLVLARPKTGRLHQIRVHLAHLGHPIVGDKLYIGDGEVYMKAVRRELEDSDLESLGAKRQMLHALSLSFPDPERPERAITVEAPPPQDFMDTLKGLEIEWP